MVSRAFLATAASGLLTFVLAGCSTNDNGAAGQQPGAPTSTSSTGSGVSGSEPRRPESLWALEPCGLITDQQAFAHGYDSKAQRSVGSTTSCEYSMTSAPTITLTITFSEVGIHELEPDSSMTAASHRIGAYMVIEAKSTTAPRCTLIIGVGDADTVGVQAKSATADDACRHAASIAEQIEPLLP
jgi:hypothetical protein